MTNQHDETDAGQPTPERAIEDLVQLNVDQLQELAARARIDGRSGMGKEALIAALTTQRD